MAASLGTCHFLAMIQIKTVALHYVLETAAVLNGTKEQTLLHWVDFIHHFPPVLCGTLQSSEQKYWVNKDICLNHIYFGNTWHTRTQAGVAWQVALFHMTAWHASFPLTHNNIKHIF